MKASLVFLLLAVFVALAYGNNYNCNEHSNGLPTCGADDTSDIKYRNFWDPTRYWVCEGNTAVVVLCPFGQAFDGRVDECVEWADWDWCAPCACE